MSRYHNKQAKLGLSYKDISERMGGNPQDKTVAKYMSGDAGVPVSRLDDFLAALELKTVHINSHTMSEGQAIALLNAGETSCAITRGLIALGLDVGEVIEAGKKYAEKL